MKLIISTALIAVGFASTSVMATPATDSLTVLPDLSAYYASYFSGASILFLGDFDAITSTFTATSATGTVNGRAVAALSDYYNYADNKTFSMEPVLDYGGVGVMDDEGKLYNFFSDLSAIRGLYNEIDTGFSMGSTIGERHIFVDNTITPIGGVPEPAAWALMVAGFGLIGTMARRRTLSSLHKKAGPRERACG